MHKSIFNLTNILNIGLKKTFDWFKRGFKLLLAWLYPPACFLCQQPIADQGFCAKCWDGLTFSSQNCCPICGTTYILPKIDVCSACQLKPPIYAQARHLLIYNSQAKKLIHACKYYDQTQAIDYLCVLLYKQQQILLQQIDFLVPVPIHYRRLFKRKFNQAALIANNLARLSKKPVLHLLQRHQQQQSQIDLLYAQRYQNVKNNFHYIAKYAIIAQNKKLLIIDDVFTSGATCNEITKLLLQRVKAKSVYILTVAKTELK